MKAILLSLLVTSTLGGALVLASDKEAAPQVRLGPWAFQLQLAGLDEKPPPAPPACIVDGAGWEGLVLTPEKPLRLHHAPQPAAALWIGSEELERTLPSWFAAPTGPPEACEEAEILREIYRIETRWPTASPDPSTVS